MTDMVCHPPHYQHPSGIECLQITRELPFCFGNAIKYVWRAEAKNGLEDLLKARFYLRDMDSGKGYQLMPPPTRAKSLLDVVTGAERILQGNALHPRARFFAAASAGSLSGMLAAVNEMIAGIANGSQPEVSE